jgi:hypothetical protein
MLTSIEYQGKIVQALAEFSWGNDLNIIFEILSNRFDSFNDNGFYPHPQKVALRQELKEVSTLRKLAEHIRALDARRGATQSRPARPAGRTPQRRAVRADADARLSPPTSAPAAWHGM